MFVFDVGCRPPGGGAVCMLDLEVDRPILGFCLIGMPAEPTTVVGFPPLNPGVRRVSVEVELDSETGAGGGVLTFEKYAGIDVGDDFSGIPPGWFVPDGLATTGAREAVVDTSKEFRLNWTPYAEDRRHGQSPRALDSNTVGDAVSE